METPPTPSARLIPRTSSFRRTLTMACLLGLVPLGTAFGQGRQTLPYVRVTHDGTEIRSLRQTSDVKMTPPKGAVLEVIYIEGDRYAHRNSNWYWVLLPPDPWATRPAGWIRGDAIEHMAPPAAATPLANRSELSRPDAARTETRTETRPESGPGTGVGDAREPATVEAMATGRLVASDVILHFPFGKSDLTEQAKQTLADAITMPKPDTRLSVALEGYADWVGSGTYNEQLGLARAETVRRYLAEQFRIPAGQISVVSYGEDKPTAPNTTAEGRAQNRRVVIKAGV